MCFLKNHNSCKAEILPQFSPAPHRVLKGRFSQKPVSKGVTIPRALGYSDKSKIMSAKFLNIVFDILILFCTKAYLSRQALTSLLE